MMRGRSSFACLTIFQLVKHIYKHFLQLFSVLTAKHNLDLLVQFDVHLLGALGQF